MACQEHRPPASEAQVQAADPRCHASCLLRLAACQPVPRAPWLGGTIVFWSWKPGAWCSTSRSPRPPPTTCPSCCKYAEKRRRTVFDPFTPATEVAQLIVSGAVSSAEVTAADPDRIERYNPQLNCFVWLIRKPPSKKRAGPTPAWPPGRKPYVPRSAGPHQGLDRGCRAAVYIRFSRHIRRSSIVERSRGGTTAGGRVHSHGKNRRPRSGHDVCHESRRNGDLPQPLGPGPLSRRLERGGGRGRRGRACPRRACLRWRWVDPHAGVELRFGRIRNPREGESR